VDSRDSRFDGQFITAVRTTGSTAAVLPATTPKRVNVEFLPTAAAAQLRGYRPAGAAGPTRSPVRRTGTPAPTWPPAPCG